MMEVGNNIFIVMLIGVIVGFSYEYEFGWMTWCWVGVLAIWIFILIYSLIIYDAKKTLKSEYQRYWERENKIQVDEKGN